MKITRNLLETLIIAIALLAASASCSRQPAEAEVTMTNAADSIEISNLLGFCPDSLTLKEGTIKNGQYFSNLLTGLGMTQQQAYDLTMTCGSTFDVKSLRVGQGYKAYYSEEGQQLEYIVYNRDRASCIVFDCKEPYDLWVYEKPIEIEKKYADVTINSSLWNDMRNAGASPLLIIGLSDIYAWTIDFFALQKGDRFRVLYEQKLCDGEVIAIDTVRYAVFTHDKQDFPMVMYNQQDGGNI